MTFLVLFAVSVYTPCVESTYRVLVFAPVVLGRMRKLSSVKCLETFLSKF